MKRAIDSRLRHIKTERRTGFDVIPSFGIFIDTHRDQPHVGTLHDDIHRGQCRPTLVDYVIDEDLLINQETGQSLKRHDKHMFVESDWYAQFLLDYLVEHGADPRDGNGIMATSHFRDPRAKRYVLRSFRQMVVYHFMNNHK